MIEESIASILQACFQNAVASSRSGSCITQTELMGNSPSSCHAPLSPSNNRLPNGHSPRQPEGPTPPSLLLCEPHQTTRENGRCNTANHHRDEQTQHCRSRDDTNRIAHTRSRELRYTARNVPSTPARSQKGFAY